ncbi:MAG TPA: T9SS type A sorting domain-containing protein, partial [Chitinophagales bacterium]|nr:T9SS type A sorting domain-containing protein [Chitinophagales bacterium]
HSSALQADGKILLAGYGVGYSSLLEVMRVLPDGTLDNSFGVNGFVNITINNASVGVGTKTIVQPDGKILVNGKHYINYLPVFTMFRLNSDGTFDAQFGDSGMVVINFGLTESVEDIVLQPDGKIVAAAGSWGHIDNSTLIVRLNSDGTIDSTFGTNGATEITGIYQDDDKHTLSLLDDGKILLSGLSVLFANSIDDTNIALARLNSDGTIDSGFGTNGMTVTDSYNGFERAIAMNVLQDGKILIAGAGCGLPYPLFLEKYNADGTLDSSFGINGILLKDLNGISFSYNHFMVQPDGKILLAGIHAANLDDFAIVRLMPGGEVDSTFGNGGIIFIAMNTNYMYNYDVPSYIFMQPDGKIVVTGTSYAEGNGQFAIARFTSPINVSSPGLNPTNLSLFVYRNPCSGSANFFYSIQESHASNALVIFDLQGKEVKAIDLGASAGTHQLSIDISALENGIYFAELVSGSRRVMQKVVVVN